MPAGYPRLASLMGAHPEMATFRRFGSLNALNLLYLQAELVDLENKLLKQAKTDAESGHFEPSIYHRDWQTLSESMTTEDGNPTQWHTMLEVRDKLKEYNQAIYLQHLMAKFGPPSEQDFRFCFAQANIGDPRQKPDKLDIHQNTVYYSHKGVIRFSTLLGTVVASLLPIGSIVVLYSLSNMTTRLALIGVFTAIFSLGLGIFTNGRMVDIFSATAAFAAVQVVFALKEYVSCEGSGA
ncbi:hypothetical protein CIB48_g2605 [Xylaria polymorpha]|nr:hypothetical protein CIB48_g2605 [Xylaria polymorpha]